MMTRPGKGFASIVLTLLLAGCRIDVAIQGQGTVTSPAGTFNCSHAGGDCSEQYQQPGLETLVAHPAPGWMFSHWNGCNYVSLDTCSTEISRSSIDDNRSWTISAVFNPQTAPVQEATYTYNALGQRMTKTVGGVTTIFQYDLDGNLIAEHDGSGRPVRQHIFLEGEPIALLATAANGAITNYYVHTDHLGTPTLITNGSGDVARDFASTPFGEPYIHFGAPEYHLRFRGQYRDGESGMHYNHFRDYAPGLGRYLQSDPIGLRGGINTYAYARNNPLTFIDPLGLAWFRPAGHPYMAGREGNDYIRPGYDAGAYFDGGYIDDYVPAGHTFATYHDALVDYLVNIAGWPDMLANIPTMPMAYNAAFWREVVHSLGGETTLPDPAKLHANRCQEVWN